jgi:hypothetical protein
LASRRFAVYDLVRNGQAYDGPNAPLKAIKYGDNWFYHGSDGYNPAAMPLGRVMISRWRHSWIRPRTDYSEFFEPFFPPPSEMIANDCWFNHFRLITTLMISRIHD